MANRINTVRPHSAPGLYFKEEVQNYSEKSLGITTLGVSGETLRGPAFQPISISNWREFQTYFGGTSTAKFKGSQYPKYELPYIAKSYLEQSNQLEVVRVLGLSGVNAGPAWTITASKHIVKATNVFIESVEKEGTTYTEVSESDFNNINYCEGSEIVDNNSNIKVADGYEWKVDCDCLQEPQCEVSIPDGEKLEDVPDDCTYIKLIDSYSYELYTGQDTDDFVWYDVVNTLTKRNSPQYVKWAENYRRGKAYFNYTNGTTTVNRASATITVDSYDYENNTIVFTITDIDSSLTDYVNNNSKWSMELKDGSTVHDYDWFVNIPQGSLNLNCVCEPYNGGEGQLVFIGFTSPIPDITPEEYEKNEESSCYERIVKYKFYDGQWRNNVMCNSLAPECNGLSNNIVIAVLRSRGEHKKAAFIRTPSDTDIANGICDDIYSYDEIEYYAKNVWLIPSSSLKLGSSCNPGFSAVTGDFTVDNYNYGRFTIKVETIYGEFKYYPVSLNPGDKDYIYNVIGGNPEEGDAEVYVEELYDVALRQLIEDGNINCIESNVMKYPAVNIIPKFKDVNDIATESVLSRRHLGNRYLYSYDFSSAITSVRYSEDGGQTWIEGKPLSGMIYTVFDRTNTITGKKEYFYGAYVESINYEYNTISCSELPSGINWIYCTPSSELSDEIQNAYNVEPDFIRECEKITDSEADYIRVGEAETCDCESDDNPCSYYKKVIVGVVDSKLEKKMTERLTPYSYCDDIVDGRFTNCVKVIADDMFYILTNIHGYYDVHPVTLDFNNYREQYRYASTPWIVSEIKGSAENVELNKLFRFHTISDGNSANGEIKVSIENIDPSTGKFDVVVRNFNDSDLNVSAIERFVGCTLVPGDPDYISLKIGSFDETYNAVSNYITVEVIENDMTKNSIPAGFLGYPVRDYTGMAIVPEKKIKVITDCDSIETVLTEIPDICDFEDNDIERFKVPNNVSAYLADPINYTCGFTCYEVVDFYAVDELSSMTPLQPYFRFNTTIDDDIKPRKQYFGVSDLTGIDIDVLSYKGVEAYNNEPSGMTPCFHLDSRIFNGRPTEDLVCGGHYIEQDGIRQTVSVDGITGYSWVTVDKNQTTSDGIEPRIGTDDIMYGTIYEDKKLRKFTVAFYGGWDGWDYYRTSRSNTNDFRYKDYKGYISSTGYGDMFNVLKNPEAFDFDGNTKVITSDYYAYLAGVRQFNNPKSIEINVLATPGIDYVNNGNLVNDVIDMVEEDRADCVYVVTTPDKPFGSTDAKDEMYTADEVVANLEDSDIDSNHTTTYYPWVKYFDSDNSEYIYLPVTRDVVKNIALTDNQAFPWFAVAGWNRGNISGVAPKKKLKLGEQDTLYDGRINFVASFAQEGDKIWGDKDLQIADNQLNRLSARRLMLRIKRMLQTACIGLLFDPNDNTCSKALRSAVATVLDYVKENRGITDYRIEIDDSPSTRDQMGLGCTYYIKRSPMLEWLSFTGVMTPQGVEW